MDNEKNIEIEVKEDQKEKGWKEKLGDAYIWCGEHKTELVTVVTTVLTCAVSVAEIIGRHNNAKMEQKLKDNYVYDARHRHYYTLNKKPRSSDWINIDQRTNNGELLGTVLKQMGFIDD